MTIRYLPDYLSGWIEYRCWKRIKVFQKGVQMKLLLAMKPVENYVQNVVNHNQAGLNIDATRVGAEEISVHGYKGNSFSQSYKELDKQPELDEYRSVNGRWPSNILQDGTVEDKFPLTKGGMWTQAKGARYFNNNGKPTEYTTYKQDKTIASSSRFYYEIKEQI